MRYISHRDITIASTCGLSAHLKKGVPTLCPPGMHDELLAVGCVPEEVMPEEVKGDAPAMPASPGGRYEAAIKAFETLTLRNKREEFNAVGVPHAAALAKELGWKLDGKERDAAWAKWQNESAPA